MKNKKKDSYNHSITTYYFYSPLSLISKQILKQDSIISHKLSLVNVAPSGANVSVRNTCRILNSTTPSEDWSVPTNLAWVTASAILWTVWGMDLCVGSVIETKYRDRYNYIKSIISKQESPNNKMWTTLNNKARDNNGLRSPNPKKRKNEKLTNYKKFYKFEIIC